MIAKRRFKVLRWSLAGKTNAEIAKLLNIHRNTVTSDRKANRRRFLKLKKKVEKQTDELIIDVKSVYEIAKEEAARILIEARWEVLRDAAGEPMRDSDGNPTLIPKENGPQIRLQALRSLREASAQHAKFLQDVGAARREPIEINDVSANVKAARAALAAAESPPPPFLLDKDGEEDEECDE